MGKMLLVAICPVFAFMIYIYQKDRYDREPSFLLFKLFVFGCLIALPVYITEKILSSFNAGSLYHAFIVAGLTEEVFKFIVVKKISYDSVSYDEKLDGIVYSVFTSLGFASVENILYVTGMGANYLYTGISRALFAIPAHMLFGITMGYYLSLAKFGRDRADSRSFLFKSLVIPIILHGIYDLILFLRQFGLFPLFILFVIYLWRTNLRKLNEYVEESRRRV